MYTRSSAFLLSRGIDDVVDAAPIHLGGGLWGLLSTALFASGSSVKVAYSPVDDMTKLKAMLSGLPAMNGELCGIVMGCFKTGRDVQPALVIGRHYVT